MYLNPDQARRLAAALLAEEAEDAGAGDDVPIDPRAAVSRAPTRVGSAGDLGRICGSGFLRHPCNPREPDALGRTSGAPR
jgi:hypothetical protein